MIKFIKRANILFLCFVVLSGAVSAQTTEFTYQGKLTDMSGSPSASYQMQFKLFNLVTGGTQIGSTTPVLNVAVNGGVFTVQLDFGAGAFDGTGRFLEIAVRRTSGESFTTLAPRQSITSAPYAIKSLNSNAADSLSAACVGCVSDANVTDVAGSKVAGEIPVLSVPAGSGYYIRNSTAQQAASGFNIDGNGVAGGTLTANAVDSATQYNIGGNRMLSAAGTRNAFAGVGAGAANTFGTDNAFFGFNAGLNNIGLGNGFPNGNNNSFFGSRAGQARTQGRSNSFFGSNAGGASATGDENSFFGSNAGSSNAGDRNSFFGVSAGVNNTASNNSFFGYSSGVNNTSGLDNSFFGNASGYLNSTGGANSFFGVSAGYNNTTGGANSFFGRSAGLSNTTGESNSYFGVQAGRDNSTGNYNSFFGRQAGITNQTGSKNSFFGYTAGFSNTIGTGNSFFGSSAGYNNTTGADNIFIGSYSGATNTTGSGNTVVGENSAFGGTTGNNNSIFGRLAGENINAGSGNAFFGHSSGHNQGYGAGANGTGSYNAFYGTNAGFGIGSGQGNVAVGADSGVYSDSGSFNTSVGRLAGKLAFANGNNLRNNNTFIGYNANGGASVSNSTAIGVNAFVTTNNTIVLGTSSETVRIPGSLVVTGTVSKGGGSFRIDHPLDPENKYLYHSFVESPDMMNVYNGNIITDANGEAIVMLPSYFDALNRDFRYQLTVIGQFAQAIVGEKIKGNSFKIRTDKPNVEVSWQVTGIRKDKFANENRIQVEVEKTEQERGEQKPQQEK